MFYLMISRIIPLFPNLLEFSWNYSESGHGKGAPDGVGAVIKRSCDRVIASGAADISNFDEFNRCIQENVKTIDVIPISEDRDSALCDLVKNVTTVKGEKI